LPIAREGWPYLVPAFLLTAAAAAAGWTVAAAFLFLLTLFFLQFFRDPERSSSASTSDILSPADGTILSVGPAPEAPAGASRRISVFMSPFHCHVNRAPIAGEVTDFAYVPGRKLAAFDEKASQENEQTRITLTGARGPVVFKQIAGSVARRVVFRGKVGDQVSRGDRIGIIKFGSRCDVFVPDGAEILVERGAPVKAGVTSLARWS
jgi:phosphatidylserine decarboxylase